jgi:flavodoxin
MQPDPEAQQQAVADTQAKVSTIKSPAIVIFYSRTGNTRTVAQAISNSLDCDLQEILDLKDRSGIKGFIGGVVDTNKNALTDISPNSVDLTAYNPVLIGSPIWGNKFCPAMATFCKAADFKGKKVILFAVTSGRATQKNFDQYSNLIETKGGNVIDTFVIKTLWKDAKEIQGQAKKILDVKAEKWMQ